MATVSDNTGNTSYKDLISRRWDLGLRGYVVHTDQQVSHGSNPTTIAHLIVDAKIENERNVHKSRKITDTLTAETVTDKHLGSAWNVLQRFADAWTVTKTNSNASTVTPLATTGSGFLVGSSDTEMVNPANWNKDDITVSAWGKRTRNEYDPELGIVVTITEEVVAHGTALPTSTTTVFYAQQQVDLARDILTTVELGSAFDRTYYETSQYTFPAILASWDGNPANAPVVPDWDLGMGWVTSYLEESSLRTVFLISIFLREAFTAPIKLKVREQLISAADAATLRDALENTAAFGTGLDLGTDAIRARLFTPRPRDISYTGVMFSLRVPNVLCDGDTLTATANSSDEYYGSGASDSCTYPDSFPTATEYIGLIGDTVCVEDSVSQWKHGLFMRRRVTLVIQ